MFLFLKVKKSTKPRLNEKPPLSFRKQAFVSGVKMSTPELMAGEARLAAIEKQLQALSSTFTPIPSYGMLNAPGGSNWMTYMDSGSTS